MLFSSDEDDISDLSGQGQAGCFGGRLFETGFAVVEQQLAETCVEAAKLREEAEFVASKDEIGGAISVDIVAKDGVEGGELGCRWERADIEATLAFVERDDGSGEIEYSDGGAVERGRWEQLLDGFAGVFRVFQVLFFQYRQLRFHVLFQEDGHVFAIDGAGEDLVDDAVSVEIAGP